MTTTTIVLAVGFVLGALVAGLSLLALVARYKIENVRLRSGLEANLARQYQTEKRAAITTKRLIDSNVENEQLKGEVERLRHDKLRAWDIPGGL